MKKIIIISALLFTVMSAFAGEDETSNCLAITGGGILKMSMIGGVQDYSEESSGSDQSDVGTTVI